MTTQTFSFLFAFQPVKLELLTRKDVLFAFRSEEKQLEEIESPSS